MTIDNRLKAIQAYHSLSDNKALIIYLGDRVVTELIVFSRVDTTLAEASETIQSINEALDILLYSDIHHYVVLPIGTKYTVIDDKIVLLTTKIHTVGQ